MFQHPKFEQTQKQIKAVMDKKQNEAKAAIDKEKDNNKKAQIFQAKRQEAAVEEKKLMDPLFKDIDMAIRSVCKAKAVTVVVDKNHSAVTALTNRSMILVKGEVVFDGPSEQVRQDPALIRKHLGV